MADDQDITSAQKHGRVLKKRLARRERQAHALRINLTRRKAQLRDRMENDALQGPVREDKDE